MQNKDRKTQRRLTASVVAVILLVLCFCITTYALMMPNVSVPDNTFHTGTVKINLNDDIPVIEEHEFLFEPGMTVKKDFFIENQGTGDVYYKIYLSEVSGGLSDSVVITVLEGDRELVSGTAEQLNRMNVGAAENALAVGERRTLSLCFRFPENAGNSEENMNLYFSVCADAVQTKNNPDRLFG